jgi:hypothetical protein
VEQEMSKDGVGRGAQSITGVFVEFHAMVVREGIDPIVAHEALLKIDEFAETIASDIIGSRATGKAPTKTTINLKAICAELKLNPRVARGKLRLAVRKPKRSPELSKERKLRSAWSWRKGSLVEKEARTVLKR